MPKTRTTRIEPPAFEEFKDGRITLRLHRGQTEAWDSEARYTFVFAGTQSGKTVFGKWWLLREIQRRGAGDYYVVTSTYDLFKIKLLPEMLKLYRDKLGWTYKKGDRVLLSPDEKVRIILRSGNAPEGLESGTGKGAWLDECGQDSFKIESWEAVLRRLSLYRGRVLGTTTVYNKGWVYSQVYNKWLDGNNQYNVIQFDSTENPAFSWEEYEEAQERLQPWRFEMFYRGRFSTPENLIYKPFNERRDVIKRLKKQKGWTLYGGIDFGGVHMAAILVAVSNNDPPTYYVLEEYLEGGKTIQEHAAFLKNWGASVFVGGAPSEDQWRTEFAMAGLPILRPPIVDVEVGISHVYELHKKGRLFVADRCKRYIDEKGRYRRKIKPDGEITEVIENKNDYHIMDAERYIISYLTADEWLIT